MKFYGKPKTYIEDPICKVVFGKTNDSGEIDVDNKDHIVMIERLIKDKKLKLSKTKPKVDPATQKDSSNQINDDLAKLTGQNQDPLKGLKKAQLQERAKLLGVEFDNSDTVKALKEKITAKENEGNDNE